MYLYSLWLDPAVRGHRLAHDLITAALDWAHTRHARTVYLRVAADNAAARAVYTSLGFALVPDADAMAGEVAMALRFAQAFQPLRARAVGRKAG